MFVSNVAAAFGMLACRLSGECHADVTPDRLPRETRDMIKENEAAETNSQSTKALMVSSAAKAARPSNHEGVLAHSEAWGTSSPGKGEVGASKACDGWGSLRPALADPIDPHPDFVFAKIGPPLFKGRRTIAPS